MTSERVVALEPDQHRVVAPTARSAALVRRRLHVGSANDRAEVEADAVADRVTSWLRDRTITTASTRPAPSSSRVRRNEAVARTIDPSLDRPVVSRIQLATGGDVIRRVQRDKSWWSGWGSGWTEDDVADEFNQLRRVWDAVVKRLGEIDARLPGSWGRGFEKHNVQEIRTLEASLATARLVIGSWDRPVPWSEKDDGRTQLGGMLDTLNVLYDQADSLVDRMELERVAQVQRTEADMVRGRQRREREAAEAAVQDQQRKQQKKADEEAETKRKAREKYEKLQVPIRARREALEQRRREAKSAADQERADAAIRAQAEADEREREARAVEEQRVAAEEEQRRLAEQAEATRRGNVKKIWLGALGRVADTTDVHATTAMKDRLGTPVLRLAELRSLVAKEEQILEEGQWQPNDVTRLADEPALVRRWTEHVTALSNAPREQYERNMNSSGSPLVRLGIGADKLWKFFGYPNAHGRDYEMPQMERFDVKYHYSLTGNSMRDLSELWNEDKSVLSKPPAEIFDRLFMIRDPERRIHVTREFDGRHLFLGDVNGKGDPIPDHFFGGDAVVMKRLLAELRDQLIGDLWLAKAKSWVLVGR